MSFYGAALAAPPPPPKFIDDIARRLVPTPSSESFDQYAALLANDLKVTVNGNEVPRGKPAWLAIERKRLGKIERHVHRYAEGRDNILIMESADDRSDEHCPSVDSCAFDPRHARAVRYELGPDRPIHEIDLLETDSILRVPADR